MSDRALEHYIQRLRDDKHNHNDFLAWAKSKYGSLPSFPSEVNEMIAHHLSPPDLLNFHIALGPNRNAIDLNNIGFLKQYLDHQPQEVKDKLFLRLYQTKPADDPIILLLDHLGARLSFPHAVQYGHLPSVELALEENPNLGVYRFEEYDSLRPIELAALQNHPPVFKLLAQRFPSTVSSRLWRYYLDLTHPKGADMALYLAKHFPTSFPSSITETIPPSLWDDQHIQAIIHTLTDIRPTLFHDGDKTLLHEAIRHQKLNAVRFFVSLAPELLHARNCYLTPLQLAREMAKTDKRNKSLRHIVSFLESQND